MQSQVEHPFHIELWREFRPFLLCVAKDCLRVFVLWLSLWCFAAVTKIFRIDGLAAECIRNIHAIGTVLLFALIAGLLVLEIWDLYMGARRERIVRTETTIRKLQAETNTL
jgi:hypothetical protein